MTPDRLAKGYEPNFDIDYQVGANGELFVASVIDSLQKGSTRIEVKTDAKIAQTGNVYIEYQCLKRGKYALSGIATTQADLWAFVLPRNAVIIAPVERVRDIARRHLRSTVDCTRGSHPTRGVVIKVGVFVQELYQ